jgi:prepilin-type N-terminal cleavage/methylation domain-containing protein
MRHRHSGFTLLEMLVATSVLALLLALFAQITSHTVDATQLAGRQIDAGSQARIALDRLGVNLNAMLQSDGIAPIVCKDTGETVSGAKNDALAFLANARPRTRSTVTPAMLRAAVVGYRVRSLKDSLLKDASVPMLNWGDGTLTWSTKSGTNVDDGLISTLQAAATDLKSGKETGVNFQGLAQGLFRFEISFLLDNGSVVTKPPRDIRFASDPVIGNDPSLYAVALRASVSEGQLGKDSTDEKLGNANYVAPNPSDPTTWRYVKAFIVGVAGLSTEVRQLIPSDLAKLADALPNPAPSTSASTNKPTPLEAWNFTSDTAGNSASATALRTSLAAGFPAPVLRSLYVYQRYYYVN